MQDSTTITELLDKLAAEIVPIYTIKSPHPITGETDCPLKKMHKDGKRFMLKERIKEIIRFYDQGTKENTE